MVAVVLAEDRWTRQPQIPVGLDPHWLQYDPVHIITGRSFLNRVGRAKFNTPVAVIRHPLGLKTSYNSSTLGSQAVLCNSDEGMMLWAGTISSSTEYKPSIMSLDHAAVGSPDWIGFRAYDTWNNTMYAGMRLGAANVKITNLGTPAHEGMIVSGGKHGWFVAKGGRTIASDPAETRWSSSFNTQTATAVWINYMNYGASSTSSYQYLIAAFFNRQPPLEEQRALSRNPWLLFRETTRSLVFDMGAGGTLITVSDSGTGSDSISSVAVTVSVSESGAGTDGFGGSVDFTLSDSGAGSDALSILQDILKSVTDSASGTDAVAISVAIALSDLGEGTDAFGGGAALTVGDSGAGSDALTILTDILKSVSDTATGADNVSISVTLSLTDSGLGIETFNGQAAFALSDSGSAVDAISLTTDVLKAVADLATGTDNVSVTVLVPISETGTGLDLLGITTLLSVLDLGVGYDVVVNSNPDAVKVAAIRFTAKTRRLAFALKTRSMTFTLN